MGRNRQPTAIKEARGNPGKRRLNEWEPIPPKGDVEPPASLKGDALAVWKRESPIAIAMRTLTTADVTLFARYCRAVAELAMMDADFADMEAEREEKRAMGESEAKYRHPFLRETDSGGCTVNQIAYYRDKLEDKVISMGERFGMNPVGRTKINVRLGDGLTPNVRPAPGSREAKQEGVLAKVVGGEVAGRNRLSIG
jgi:phage terminase small subunit